MTNFEHSVESVVASVAPTVASGKCVLFLGAGVHSGPPDTSVGEYPIDQRPWSARQLSEHLAEKSEFAATLPSEDIGQLSRTSMLYELRFGRSRLLDAINGAVQESKTPSRLLADLARLPFQVIITTNYDSLFEEALRAEQKRPDVSHYVKDMERTDDWDEDASVDRPYVLKLHGDITDRTARESIVITDEDYMHFLLRMNDRDPFNPVPTGVKHYLTRRNWKTLFIGYSLRDYNLKLLFRSIRRKVDQANLPQAFSVDHQPDPLILETWQREEYVWILKDDIWRFVPALAQAVADLTDSTEP